MNKRDMAIKVQKTSGDEAGQPARQYKSGLNQSGEELIKSSK